MIDLKEKSKEIKEAIKLHCIHYKNYIEFKLRWFFKKPDIYLKSLAYEENNHYIEIIYLIQYKLKKLKEELKKDIDFNPKDIERLDDLINLSNQMIDIINKEGLTENNNEYQKLSKSFFNKLYRLHDKLYSIKDIQLKIN